MINGFQLWMHRVSLAVSAISGLSVMDLSDYEYHDCYMGGEDARDVADAVLAENGYSYGVQK